MSEVSDKAVEAAKRSFLNDGRWVPFDETLNAIVAALPHLVTMEDLKEVSRLAREVAERDARIKALEAGLETAKQAHLEVARQAASILPDLKELERLVFELGERAANVEAEKAELIRDNARLLNGALDIAEENARLREYSADAHVAKRDPRFTTKDPTP